ncbi:RNA polymerase sigma factor [Kocuria soli]|uniref:RNA polymerase sigma factor n=1 Tax=Kocuria soli TaxID=2485125 RepID=A0A3N3ZP67_9MICC|nr:RNA polymerase sigma factor [Kocuria soli]ROZ62774.1 RNA polymerase sigma factor [Kocuria soli]
MKTHTTNTQKTLNAPQEAAQSGLEANSEQAWLAVAETMPAVAPVIRSMLAPAGLVADAEDIAQEAIISAVRSIHRWNPAGGPLVSWVTAIGKRRAIDHLRRASRQATTAVVFAGQAGEDETVTVIDVPEASFEDELLDRDEAWGLVKAVLGQVKVVLRNDEILRRAVVVLADCDGEIAEASRRLGISAPVAREARRQVVRMAIVVHQAQRLHRQRVTEVRIDAALDCLPDEAGSWPRLVLEAIARHGNLRTFGPADLVGATGWGMSTCRQRFEDVSWLLSVINAIALHGEIATVPATPRTASVAI